MFFRFQYSKKQEAYWKRIELFIEENEYKRDINQSFDNFDC